MTNSLKYVFLDGNTGTLRMKLHEEMKKVLAPRVADNGSGLPSEFEIEGVQSLGLQLVSSLVKQLDGQLEVQRSQETAFQVTFKVRRLKGDRCRRPTF